MSYFKVYQSIFKKETNVAELTDLQKVLVMLLSSEMNRKEAKSTATGESKIIRFSHYWMGAAMSSHRTKLSKAFKQLAGYGFFDYTSGYNVNGGRTAPSTVRNLATEEYFAQIDRFTFENLLYDKLKNKEIQYRHIVVYALCKYIEQFEGGSISVNEFGQRLGMTVQVVNYSRIKKHLEDLEAMKLISFQKGRGKLEGITAQSLPLNRGKQHMLRETISQEAEQRRYEELGIINSEAAAAVEDMAVPMTLENVIDNVKDVYAKRFGKKAILDAGQKKRIQGIKLTIKEIHELSQQFFTERYEQLRQTDGKYVFGIFSTYLQGKMLDKQFSHA